MAAVLSPKTDSSSPSPTSKPSRSPQPSVQSNNNIPPSLPPLVTSPPSKSSNPRRISSYANKRLSAISAASNAHSQSRSRPQSSVFPMFHSSLPYALVRDFAYPSYHPMHYGPPPDVNSGISTPASESQRRLSDPQTGQWSAVAWGESGSGSFGYGGPQLPSTSFADGPPWSEDEDLHSPKVTAARHKKHKSTVDFDSRGRGRDKPDWRASYGGGSLSNGDFYFPNSDYESRQDSAFASSNHQRFASNYLNPHSPTSQTSPTSHGTSQYTPQPYATSRVPPNDAYANHHNSLSSVGSLEESRFSRDYQFTIASPDEEMHGKAIALFDFARENENELPLLEGQVILVSYRHGQGWLVAQDPLSGESGLVPEEYVRLLRELNLEAAGEGGWDDVRGLGIGSEGNYAGGEPDGNRYVHEGDVEGSEGQALYMDNPSNSSVTSPWTPRANSAEAVTPTQAHHDTSGLLRHERDSVTGENRGMHSTSNSNASSFSTTSSNSSAGAHGSGNAGVYPPVVSTFSTSSKDFEIMHGRAMSTPALKIPGGLQGRRSSKDRSGEGTGTPRRSEDKKREDIKEEDERETVDVKSRDAEDARKRLEGQR
ncbi:MAG: HOG (high osmolarity glycerol) pathway protein [Bogoriella megaspora]|nr:MAG: HOG (high osmolarity glycerol) pathway protein [Bogoriella megaspora]